MDLSLALFATALLALLGTAWLTALIPGGLRTRTVLVLGYGLLSGMVAMPLLMRAQDLVGLPLSFQMTGSLAAVLIALALVANYLRKSQARADGFSRPGFNSLSNPYKLLFATLTILLVCRISILGLEVLARPLFPFDATMHWATKARVWFEYGNIIPFVENKQWLRLGGEGVFTDRHPHYPITTPLLQVWFNLAVGYWNESLMNLPWVLCLIALAAAFYGQSREAGASSTAAIAFTYFLVSMPLLNTHVALAGYADFFLGACYCAAIMAFHNWSVSGNPWQGIMALFFALACPLIKNEGLFWLMSFAPALVVVLLPGRRAAITLALALAGLLVALALFPEEAVVAGHTLKELNLQYHPDALQAIAKNLMVHDNWHLLGYMLLFLLPLWLISARSSVRAHLGIAAALSTAAGLYLMLFLYTKYAYGAEHHTAVGRISLHLVPALTYFAMLLWKEISSPTQGDDPPAPAAT